ncbi:MAG: hypothetical protein ACRDNH_04390 [Gaiellaceae bacterium]
MPKRSTRITPAGSATGRRARCTRTEETWQAIGRYPVDVREQVVPRRPFTIAGLTFEAFQQLDWCRTESVPRAVFTHCGSQIVRDHAHDGLIVTLR